ncbi:MAG: DEAD/DEAH box helicase [Deltaproteobacteria bacterium]|nr:DEAD/DEAH box helicase [Deltaproteobacteria bacterium]
MSFDDLGLIDPLLRAVREEGYHTPTPIQRLAIPPALAGRDVLGIAQTGTGKTAAFALPILQGLVRGAPDGAPRPGRRPIRVLILTPTRELATQIGDAFAVYGRHLSVRHTVVFGGVGQGGQERALRAGVDVLVACPGRLLDLLSQGLVDLRSLGVFVLDEADRMLDMGFLPDVRRVVRVLPSARQTMFFSATMPPDIQQLADGLLRDPARVEATPVATAAETVGQALYFVEKGDKRMLLAHLLRDPSLARVLVFSRTKHGADRVVKDLAREGFSAQAIHGNKSQNNRERALDGFRGGSVRVLVATDIAARGIDVDGVTHVVNFDLPNVAETYVHRIGRTGRAGARGEALSFCDQEEREYLRDIERLLKRHVPRVESHPHRSPLAPPPPTVLGAQAHGRGPPRPVHHDNTRDTPRNGPRPPAASMPHPGGRSDRHRPAPRALSLNEAERRGQAMRNQKPGG